MHGSKPLVEYYKPSYVGNWIRLLSAIIYIFLAFIRFSIVIRRIVLASLREVWCM